MPGSRRGEGRRNHLPWNFPTRSRQARPRAAHACASRTAMGHRARVPCCLVECDYLMSAQSERGADLQRAPYSEKPAANFATGFSSELLPGSDLLSHTPAHAVPSAVAGLTSVFGMGTGDPAPMTTGKLVAWGPAFARVASFGGQAFYAAR